VFFVPLWLRFSPFEKETSTMSLELKQTLKDLEQKIEDLKGYL